MRLRTFVTVFILLFWGTMMVVHVRHEFGVFRTGTPSSAPRYARENITDYLTREDQVDYLIQNEDREEIGDMQRRLVRTSPEIVVKHRIRLDLSELIESGDGGGRMIINKRNSYRQNGRLSSFRMKFRLENQKLHSFLKNLIPYRKLTVSGERKDGSLIVWFGNRDNGSGRQLDTSQISSSLDPLGSMRPPDPGTTRTIQVMDPLQKGSMEVQISTSPTTRPILWQDQKIDALEVKIKTNASDSSSLRGTVWITENGTVLRQEISHPLIPYDLLFLRISSLPEHEDTS